MIIETDNFELPSDPELRRKIRELVKEAADIMTMIAAQREALKDAKARAVEELEVPKKILNKMIKAFYNQDFPLISQENEMFELFYENIIGDAVST